MRNVNVFIQSAIGGLLLCAMLLFLASACNRDGTSNKPSVPVSNPPAKPPAPDQKDLNRELEALQLLVDKHNTERSRAGAPMLTPNAKLMAAAKYHANWMASNKKMSHNGDGVTPWQRINSTGYKFTSAGENIAYGYRSPTSVMGGWMNSHGHRENILNRNYTELGVAVTQDSTGVPYWCVVFARPAAIGAAMHPEVSPHYPPAIYADGDEINDFKGFLNEK